MASQIGLLGDLESQDFHIAAFDRRFGRNGALPVSLGVCLIKLPGRQQYGRAFPGELIRISSLRKFEPQTIYVRQTIQLPRRWPSQRLFAFYITHALSDRLFDPQVSASSREEAFDFSTEKEMTNIIELRSLQSFDGTSQILELRFQPYGFRGEERRWQSSNGAAHSSQTRSTRLPKAVTILLRWNSQTGSYGGQLLYGDFQNEPNNAYSFDNERTEMKLGATWQQSKMLNFKVNMYTRIFRNFPVIAVDITAGVHDRAEAARRPSLFTALSG